MPLRKYVYAALAMAVLSSCSSPDTKATYASSSPNCNQLKATDSGPNSRAMAEGPDDKTGDADHVLTKVGRTVFWLEITLLEQNKKSSSQCRSPQQ
jgi:hypothetical protein